MRFSLSNQLQKGDKQSNSGPSVLEKHWGTIVSLIGIFLLALLVRGYFAFELATRFGTPYLVSGGSDAYYYRRIIDFISTNHYHLFTEPMLNYPVGRINPRPPFFAWSVAIGGYVVSPLVGDLNTAISYVFILSTGVWGALTIFPTYLIGRDIFGKKAGIAAAFLMAISSGHLQRSIITNGDHDAIYLFFGVTAFYFFMKALEGIDSERNWVLDWTDKEKIKQGLLEFFIENKKQLLYSVMAGIAIGTVALTWKGFAYLEVIVLAYFAFQLFIDKFRRKDSLGVTMCVGVAMATAFLLAAPYYLGTGIGTQIPMGLGKWFDVPLVLFLIAFGIGMFFTVTRDIPWLIIISITGLGVALFYILGTLFFPGILESLFSGAGYFIQNKLYSTIAEAQAPVFSNLVLSFGMLSFFFSIIGIGLAIWHLKGEWNQAFIFILIWTAFAIYMAISAARFIFNSSPAFALTAGWVLALLVDKTNFSEIAKRFRSYRGDVLRGIYEGVKIKHILVALVVVFLIMMPNALYAFDAGIPFEKKNKYNDQIYEALPNTLRPPEYNASSGGNWYLGAFGYSLDKPGQYWPAAWDWFEEQDQDMEPEERPAFLSWWDYGFEAANEGKHPTVADNFQAGYRLAGNVLMAQNESEILSLLINRILQKPLNEEGEFNGEIRDILVNHIGEQKTNELEDLMNNYEDDIYKERVLANPDKYHPRAKDIHPKNVMYAYTMGLLSSEGTENLANLYRELCLKTDKRIKYFAADSRLFPFSGRQTGIFYAPAKLSGHRIDESQGMRTPVDFFTIKLIDTQGNEYDDPDEVPRQAQIQDYRINYKPMFYNSTLYRILVGFSGSDIGMKEDIPGLSQQMPQPMPGWNMTHFKMAYRTAYYNPYKDFKNHTGAWKAVSYDFALQKRKEGNGTVDLSGMGYLRQGVVFLEYYDGAIVTGNVTTRQGEPVSNVTVTVHDETSTVHYVTKTDKNGHYKAIVPAGEIDLIVTTGRTDRAVLHTNKIQLGVHEFNVTEEMAMRKKVDRDLNGEWDYKIKKDFEISGARLNGHIYVDEDGDSLFKPQNDTVVNGEITAVNQNTGNVYHTTTTEGEYTLSGVVPGMYTIKTNVRGGQTITDITVNQGGSSTNDVIVSTGEANLDISLEEGIGLQEDLMIEVAHQKTGLVLEETVKVDNIYQFDNLLPGKYNVKISTPGYTFSDGEMKLQIQPNSIFNTSATIVPASELYGQVELGGQKLVDQTIIVSSSKYSEFDQSVKTDSDGEFSLKLPEGRYRLYGKRMEDGKTYVYMDTVSIPEEDSVDCSFQRGFEVKGKVNSDGSSEDSYSLLFKHDSGKEILVPTNSDGGFSTHIIKGNYEVYGWKIEPFKELISWKSISVTQSTTLNIEADSGNKLSGSVYRDEDKDGEFDKGEGLISDIEVIYRDEIVSSTYSNNNGYYETVVPDDECTIRFDSHGFFTNEINYDPEGSETRNVTLVAKDITVSGDIYYTNYTPESLPLRFDEAGEGAVSEDFTVSGDGYSVELQPGIYNVKVNYTYDSGSRKLWFDEEIHLQPGNDMELDLILKDKLRLMGVVKDNEDIVRNANVSFLGPQKENITTEGYIDIYLSPGQYGIMAINEKAGLSNQIGLELSEPKSIEITLQDMIEFSALVTYEGNTKSNVTVELENLASGYIAADVTDSTGEATLSIVPGEYRIAVNHIEREPIEGVLSQVRYYYHDQLNISSNLARQLTLSKELVNATLSGTVEIDGQSIENADIEFIGTSPEAVSTQTTTDEEGNFEVELFHGLYTIYASYSDQGLYSTLDNFAMGEEDDTVTVNLHEAVLIEGKVIRDGTGTDCAITFKSNEKSSEKRVVTNDEGYYDILLPKGRYTATARKLIGDTTYRNEKVVELEYSRTLDFQLKKVKEYGIEIGDVSSRTAQQGDEITYQIDITNTGNTMDTFNLSGKKSVWDMEFDPKSFDIGADRTKTVTVKVFVDENASVDHPPISFNVKSMNSEKQREVNLPIDVEQVYGVKVMTKVEMKTFRGGFLNYTMKIRNTGNGKDTFNLAVLNKEDIQSKGWNVTISKPQIMANESEDKEVIISLRSIRPSPSKDISLKLSSTSANDLSVSDTATIDINTPTITSDESKFKLKDDKISLEEQEFSLETWQWAAIIILVGAVALYIMRKERWI